MQPWNQWGVQASTGYTLPGYPAAMPSPVVTVAPTVSSLPYTMGGYQWPSYSATNVTPTVGGGWPVQNQQQQWDQWTQWQQQYAQWQQEYGDKYMQSVQQSTQASSTTSTTVPMGVPPATAIAGGDEKRAAPGPPDAKKPKTDENSVEAIKDVLKEMAEAEKQFDEQFNNWEVQFNTWREQNASHPDTEQYKAYEAKWKSWRNQLLQRREQMRKKRAAKMAELTKLEQQPSTSFSGTGTVGITASMAVPPPTLGATSVASASITPAVTPAVLPSTAVPPPGMNPSGADNANPYALYNTSFYNQQGGYMFGSSPYAVPPVFPPVPPPVVAPTSTSAPPPNSSSTAPPTTSTITSAVLAEAGQNKPVDSTSTNNVTANSGSTKPPDQQSAVNFSQPPPSSTTQASSTNNVSQNSSDGGGIPGLDLINHPSSSQSSKQPEFNPTSTSNLIPKQQEIIQTPADSKPFDFPSPAKNQNTTVPPPSMMNFPPPGYLNPTFKVFQMGTNPNPGLLPSKHNPNKELVEALMNTIETNPGLSQDGRNQNYNMNRHQRSDFDHKGSNAPPGGGQDFRGNQMNNYPPPNNFSDNQWSGNQPTNKAPLLPTPSIQGYNPPGKQSDIHMGPNGNMPPFNQPSGFKNNEGPPTFRNDGPSPRFGGPQGFRANDGPPCFRGSDGPPSGFKNDGLPPGFRADGPPPDFRSDGPPPNFRNDGPSNFRGDGSQTFRNDGHPNFRGNDGMRQNGPQGFRGSDCGPGYRGGNDGPPGFREGPPPGFRDGPGFRSDGFRGDNIRSNDGHGSGSDNFRSNNYRKDDFDRPYMNDDGFSYGKGSEKNREDPEGYNQDFNDNRSDRGRNDYNDESYDNHSDDRGPLGSQRDFRYHPTGSDSQDRNSFNDGDGSLFGRHAFGPNARSGGPTPLMGSGGSSMSGAQGGPVGPGGQMASRFQLPPLHNPDKIIDYIHKPANLGVPAFYEPVTMIDYAHGAHKLPEGEEDRFPPGENRDLFPKDDDYDGRLHGPGRGPSPFRSRNDGRRRGTTWGRTRESRWERDPHGSPPSRRDEGRSRDREERGRDDRRDRDGRDDRHDRDRRDERDRDSRRDSRRDDRRDDRRDRDLREDKRDERGESPRREERWRHDKSGRHDDERHKDDRKDRDRSTDKSKDSKRNSVSKTRSPTPPSRSLKEESSLKMSPENIITEISHNPVLLVDDILLAPGRERRPPRIVVILRGPPGSGKTFVAKLMKDKEVEMGGSAPRILSLDDYFMVETEKEEMDEETGRTTTVKTMEYEYESGMEPHYRESLIKAFRKTIIDGYFPFIIVDCINDKLSHFEELSSFAKQKGFQVYICEMDLDISLCVKRNVHKRTEEEIKNIVKNWEKTPLTETILDVRSLLQSASITEVNMEDTDPIEDMPDEMHMEDEDDKRGNDIENKNNENVSKVDDSSRDDRNDNKDSKSAENDIATKTGSTGYRRQGGPPPLRIGFSFQRTTSRLPSPQRFQGRRGYGGPIWRSGGNRRR